MILSIFLAIFFILMLLANTVYYSLFLKYFNKKFTKKDFIMVIIFIIFIILITSFLRIYWFPGLRVFYLYLGFLNFAFFSSLFFWFFYFVFKILKLVNITKNKFFPLVFIIVPFIVSSYATYNFFQDVKVEVINITSDKVKNEYKFVQVSDIQYGTVTKEYMNKVIDLIKEQEPDFVLFVGDLIDFNLYQEKDFERFSEIKAPIFFERGNHEFYHFPEKLLLNLQKISNIRLLIDKKESYKELDITGIDFKHFRHFSPEEEGDYLETLESIEIDKEKFNILIYHEPRNVSESLESGFDLLLYGHTHAGQIWPFTEIIDYLYEYSDGLYEVGESLVYTSDGAGLWGPRMRLGSQNEIVVFNLKPE